MRVSPRRSISIAILLSLALAAVVTVLLGAFGALTYAYERDERREDLRNALTVGVDQLATGLALPLWNLDDKHVQAILTSGLRHREIFAISASSAGRTYRLGRHADGSIGALATEPAAGPGLLAQEHAIVHNGQEIGHVRALATTRFLDEDLRERGRSIVLVIVALDIVMVTSLYLLLWQLLVKPLRSVERFASAVQAGEGLASVAAPEGARFVGELRTLALAVRDMTRMLDSRLHALRANEERLRLATRAANVGIWDWDVDKDELVWDDQMYRLFGIPKDAYARASDAWASKLAPQDLARSRAALKAALSGKQPYAVEFEIRRPDGAVRTLRGEGVMLRDAQGRVHRMVGVNFDISERRLAQQTLERSNAELEQRVRDRTAQLEAATRAKSEFLANMSHEIRTPMNAILGMNELALRTQLDSKQRGYLSKVKVAANSLLAIINDILDFSKVEAGKLELESREFVLQDVLDRVTAVVGLKAQEKGLDLLLNTATDVPPVLVGDPLRLEQVLINLCSNAVKFTTDGEIVVVTVCSLVTEDSRVTLRFSVRDTGVGIAEEQIGKLFQPFNQLDASTTRQFGGTGLGLAICRQLVTMMGGEIGVASKLGKGSTFSFTAVFGTVGRAASMAASAVPSADLRHLRILVVDDSADSCQIFGDLLRGLGYQPVIATSAAAALAELERADASQPYDLVLLDWKMPGVDGFGLAGLIRRSPRLRRVPRMVMVTAYGDEALTRRAAAQRLDGCLAKPVSASTLLDAIMNVFGPEADAQPSTATPAAQDAGTAPPQLHGRRVLLVEDNEFNRIVASELLSDVAGMQVTVAVNGQQALELIRGQRFDAVLMDVQMPVMDGCQATVLVREDPALAALPIIAMTAHAMARDRDKCLAVGMNDYVCKPFDPRTLFDVLAKWVGGRPAGAVAESVAAPASEPAVSFELGLQRCLGRRELYHEVIRRFLETAADEPAKLQAAVTDAELPRAAELAHAMISTAGTLGAVPLSATAREIEVCIAEGEVQRLAQLVQAFERAHRDVFAELRHYLARESEGLR
ncbi:MAG TPA: response regulator [Burkholderiaceae bacterium]|nr:response regulator [Burkholderiaceae bacterium]